MTTPKLCSSASVSAAARQSDSRVPSLSRTGAGARASALRTALIELSDFLSYGTTAQVARLHGAGEQRRAGGLAAQALWLALATGALVTLLVLAIAGPAAHLLGGTTGHVHDLTVTY